MPFTKFIPYKEKDLCTSREHEPPQHIVLKPGTHIYKCPKCGKETVLNIAQVKF